MKVALFNGLNYHYEMFGYIIYYCYKNNFELNIYTETCYENKWFQFYKELFRNYSFTINKYNLLEHTIHNYNIIFLPTDNDPFFPNDWVMDNTINKKIICINHFYQNRMPVLHNHIGTRPFMPDNYDEFSIKKWAIPCYPIIDFTEKYNIIDNDICNIVIIGGESYNVQIINRFRCNKKIILHVISRDVTEHLFHDINSNIELRIYKNLDTISMMNLLKKMNFLLTDITYNYSHVNGKTMSGAIPIAFSNLLCIIISKHSNYYYKFESALVYDIEGNDNIIIPDDNIQLELINDERNTLINMFHSHMESYLIT